MLTSKRKQCPKTGSRGRGRRAIPDIGLCISVVGLAVFALAVAPAVLGHAGERGFILLLPTQLYQVGGAVAVAVSFLVVSQLRAVTVHRAIGSTRWRLFPVPRRVPGAHAAAAAVLIGLITAGFVGSRDPLANPLPLAVWALFWVGLTGVHAVFGYVWPRVNPWTALARLVRRISGWRGGDDTGRLVYPDVLGAWPAVALLLLFAWFELVFPAPWDPAILAFAAIGYSICTVTGMVLFGDAIWMQHVEIFSRFFRIVSWIAPLHSVEEGGVRRLAVTFPGARLLTIDAPSTAGVVFVVAALAAVSFDGLSRTFWWLALLGENPLEPPGRTALIGRNTLGLIGTTVALLTGFTLSVAMGAWWSGIRATPALRRWVVSIVPIAIGYHVAHYLPSFLVDAQYALKAISDPLHRGWNLLGARDLHVTVSFLTNHASVVRIWYVQVGVIVAAHAVAVVILHGIVGASSIGRSTSILRELPLTVLMIGYTVFGLWLLSTPLAV